LSDFRGGLGFQPHVRLTDMAGGSEGREFSFLTAWCMKLFLSLVVRQQRLLYLLPVRSVFCPSSISEFVSLVLSHVCSLVLSSCFLVPAMCFPMFVCLCHVPSCCCPCLHPSP